MESILIIAARANQMPLILKAKEKYRVVICEIAEDTPGRVYADSYYCLSEQTVENVAEIARVEHVSGVITNSEPLLMLAEEVRRTVGLPSSNIEAVKLLTDKCLMRNHLEQYADYALPHRLCTNSDSATEFFALIGHKSIMKPLDSSASRGVYTVKSADDIKRLFSETQKYSKDKKSVLMEEYIDGTEFTLDGIVSSDGRHSTLAISQKKHYSYNENVACELMFSYHNPDFDYDELRRINDEIVELSGYTFGMTHAEYKYDGQRFRLIEMMARGGGSYIASDIVPFMSGVDSYDIFIDMACGKRHIINGVADEFRSRCAILKFFDVRNGKSGVVKRINGVDFLQNTPQIIRYELLFKEGDFLQPADDDSKRIGYYIACAENMQQLKDIVGQVETIFSIEYEGDKC